MADAMQDAVDGNYGQTHEWDVSPGNETTRMVDNGRLNIAVSVAEFERLVELIDNLLEE
ncbi:hypothetical protein QM588_05125 [Rhodococcus sp. IEGM 1354]|uniref:hypothetical protein n=1 Tax=Rhodococcus sp. IEGM 1354 TaxID=3047088 RepID=UPI0024B841DF|nr:hypothetical protein [Rhodococcus sp. IEGM 1354]MDI9929779.1 hypothetical protein [Rhodococcus sp. IEGM 1354]